MIVEGKTFLITGGSEGIGLACAGALAERGANVCIVSRSEDRLRAAAEQLPERQTAVFAADVRRPEEIRSAVEKSYRTWGRLDGLIHASGVSMRKPEALGEIAAREYRRIMETNADGAFYTCSAALPFLEEQKEAVIILISSTAAWRAGGGTAPYSASKHALRAMAEALAAEKRGTGIRVSTISPGPVSSNIWSHKETPPTDEQRQKMLAPGDIAEIALFMAERPGHVQIEDIKVTPWFF